MILATSGWCDRKLAMDEMKPGRELDALIAEKVMGWQRWESGVGTRWKRGGWSEEANSVSEVPAYSTDIAAAWEVVEHFRKNGFDVTVSTRKDGTYVNCEITNYDDVNVTDGMNLWDAPHAIALAALKAVGMSDEKRDEALSRMSIDKAKALGIRADGTTRFHGVDPIKEIELRGFMRAVEILRSEDSNPTTFNSMDDDIGRIADWLEEKGPGE